LDFKLNKKLYGRKTIAPEEELKDTKVDEPETEEPATPTVEDIIEPKRAEEQVPLKDFLGNQKEKKDLERDLKTSNLRHRI
jgi:hypothetical protein